MTEATAPRVAPQTRLLIAFCLVQWATFAALVWKIGAFMEMTRCYFSIPLRQEFFPAEFQSTILLIVVYFSLLFSLAIAALMPYYKWRNISCWAALLLVSMLCVHQGSYNDMTFATAWWTSLWSVWLASRMNRDEPERLLARAAFLSRCIVSMILLGGAVGKWTSEYWSGQVLYEIYFVDRDFWFFNLMRGSLDPDALPVVATWYSRLVILVESVCGIGLWLLPARLAAIIAMLVMTSIAVFSNFNLFSVLFSLIGLAAVGCFVVTQQQPGSNMVPRKEA